MISFVIPTLNEESVIEKTLRWIASYSCEKEIIVSDGGSHDKTLEIARKFTDKIVVYSDPRRQTIGMARNMGAAIAQGDFIVFVDADVVILRPDEFFRSALSFFEAKRDIIALTSSMRVLPERETRMDKIVFSCLGYIYFFLNNVIGIGASSGELQMMRIDTFKRGGGFDEERFGGEDNEHFRRLAKIGRTYFAHTLCIYHTGRRAHSVGWPKLLLTWFIVTLPRPIQALFIKEWKEVR